MTNWLDLSENPFPLKEGGKHVFDEDSVHAANGALAAGRPLLVRGEPGSGKSQLARAAAAKLGRPFVRHVVDAQTDARDLLYDFDGVGRLAQAQLLGALGGDQGAAFAKLAEARFTRPGVLWWALNWDGAAATAAEWYRSEPSANGGETAELGPEAPSGWTRAKGVVVLIDELDKGDPSVPNGLLAALGDAWFDAPGGQVVERDGDQGDPLIIVTTNGERALPAAFVRRCFVLDMPIPDANDEVFAEFAVPRGEAQVPGLTDGAAETYRWAADRVWRARQALKGRTVQCPGLAEYIDLLRAVDTLRQVHKDRKIEEILDRLERYVLRKHPGMPVE